MKTEDAVKDGVAAAGVVGAGAVATAVSGASGASIMTTLATTGVVVGGGVVAGVGSVSAGAGLGAAHLLNRTAFRNHKKAQVGSYTGAVAGTLGSVGTLLTAGAGPSGLATIGGVIGGGMAVGAITVLATPVVCAAVIGGLVYCVSKQN